MKKSIKIILIALICFTISITKINAKSYIKDLFQAGEKVTIDNKMDGTSFIAGDKIGVNETINGIGFIAGNEIEINAPQEYLFGLGTKININKDIEKDLFLFSSTINIDSNIKRDAYIAGELVKVNGTINRNIYIYGTEVNLNGSFNGNVVIYGTIINIDENTKISGTLKYNKDAIIEGLNDDVKTKTYEIPEQNISFKDYIANFITTYIHITLLAIVLVFISENLFKSSLKQTDKLNSKNVAILCGKGFVILIGVPIIAMMLLFSGAFISVGVVGGLIYGILVYISQIFTGYLIANLLDKKYFKKNMNSYLLVIIGLFIINVLGVVPYIGGAISFLSTLLGLGIIGNMIIEAKK